MKRWLAMKEKTKIIAVLLVVLVLALLNNHFSRMHYEALDKNIVSIYKDRLMPSSYLFKLNDHLYQKKILVQDPLEEKALLLSKLDGHNISMQQLTRDYEKTYLTRNEEEYWRDFVGHLRQYNLSEAALVGHTQTATVGELQSSFDKAIGSLNMLNELQTTEGFKLQHESKSIIGNTLLRAYLEVSLLFILGIIALRMLTTYEKVVYPAMGSSLLN